MRLASSAGSGRGEGVAALLNLLWSTKLRFGMAVSRSGDALELKPDVALSMTCTGDSQIFAWRQAQLMHREAEDESYLTALFSLSSGAR